MEGHQLPYVWVDDEPDVPAFFLSTAPRTTAGCEVDPCYVFHPLNAFDLPDGRIQMEVVDTGCSARSPTGRPRASRH